MKYKMSRNQNIMHPFQSSVFSKLFYSFSNLRCPPCRGREGSPKSCLFFLKIKNDKRPTLGPRFTSKNAEDRSKTSTEPPDDFGFSEYFNRPVCFYSEPPFAKQSPPLFKSHTHNRSYTSQVSRNLVCRKFFFFFEIYQLFFHTAQYKKCFLCVNFCLFSPSVPAVSFLFFVSF